MKKQLILLSLSALLSGSSALAFPCVHQDKVTPGQEKLARLAKITREQAQEIALKRAPGHVESSELEKEHGRLVYSFDIRNTRETITEVQVSAISGKIVRVEHENKKQEEAEKKKEQKP
jgi:Peptidase propeptide and YPEB domain